MSTNAFFLMVILLFQYLFLTEAFAHSIDLALSNKMSLFKTDSDLALDEKDWQWFRNKDVLVVGIVRVYDPPFGFVVGSHSYEGITAEYLALIATLLNVRIEIRHFDSISLLHEALSSGEVDMFASDDDAEVVADGRVKSQIYLPDRSVLVMRSKTGSRAPTDLEGLRLAVVTGYFSEESLKRLYPKAEVQFYPNALAAIGAVAFTKADVYLGGEVRSSYLVQENFQAELQLLDVTQFTERGGFFVFKQNGPLLRGVNASLKSIRDVQRTSILQRWSPENYDTVKNNRIALSDQENRWLAKNPVVKVAVHGGIPPFSYFDSKGRFSGLAARILEKITDHTGLKFEVVSVSNNVEEQLDLIKSGAADLLAMAMPSTYDEFSLKFTRPYSVSPYVLVSRNPESSELNSDQLSDEYLAMCSKSTKHQLEGRLFFGATLNSAIEFNDVENLFSAVVSKKMHAAAVPLKVASYMLNRGYDEKLRIYCSVGDEPENITLATSRGALELFSILEKALAAISPMELVEMKSRADATGGSVFGLGNNYGLSRLQSIYLSLVLAAVFGWALFLVYQIRARKLAEKALSDQLNLMRALIDGLPHPVFVRDRVGRLVICNDRYLKELNVDGESVLGKLVSESPFADVIDTQAYQNEYLKAMQDGSYMSGDRQVKWRDGRTLTLYGWALPFHDSNGKVLGLIGGWIDVSERQILVEQLQNSKQVAEDANQAKTVFLANMSHEIRTPMNAVIGMLELALEKAEQGVIDTFALDVASGAARGMMELIGDILDIARIESGRLSLTPERANLRDLVESVVRIFDAQSRQKRLKLVLDIQSDVNHEVLIDPLRFKQILSNLLSNAIKFTKQGEVRLILVADSEASSERMSVRLKVQDTGIGISSEDQQYLFTPFSRANNNQESIRSGAGLGLMISRTLCELMGGNLYLHSELGKGTTVEVALNLVSLLPLPSDECVLSKTATQLHSLNILVVDDYPANRQLLSRQLSYLGHSVTDAPDGAHGLRAWRNSTFDVLITDCNMPTMDGYELTRAIRDIESTGTMPRCTILGFTANAQLEERARCMEAGMDDCLFKPISLHDLAKQLASITPLSLMIPSKPQPVLKNYGVSLCELEKLTRGDAEFLRGLIQDLARSNRDDLERLRILASNHDLNGLSNLAHRVKGGARIIKYAYLIECCEALEEACTVMDSMRQDIAIENLRMAMSELASVLED